MSAEMHELFIFMRQIASEMRSEYERITNRSKQDPGTAGDDGEENWASLLRSWLPATYPIVTKGRILGSQGRVSPQVDVLVLSANYPNHLRSKKMYFAGGVLAAFECKLTLRKADVEKVFQNSAKVKEIEPRDPLSPYEYFNQRIMYGLLCHAHAWKRAKTEDAVFAILDAIVAHEHKFSGNLSGLPDVICISSTVTYVLHKDLQCGKCDKDVKEMLERMKSEAALLYGYYAHYAHDGPSKIFDGTVHGTLISAILHKLGYIDPSVRELAKYWGATDIEGAAIGRVTGIPVEIDRKLLNRRFVEFGGDANPWNEWGGRL